MKLDKYTYNGKEEWSRFGLGVLNYGARMLDYTGRWNGIDNKAEDYYSISPYAYCLGNPLKYVDPDGEDPREGNHVNRIDFSKSWIARIGDDKPRIKKTDKVLYSNALREFSFVSPVGGSVPGISGRAGNIIGANSDMENDMLKARNLSTWMKAAVSQTGYDYTEYSDDGLIKTDRIVENLNEKLGIEKGFENVVTDKRTYDISGEHSVLKTMEFWSYKIEEDKDGKVKVMYRYTFTEYNVEKGYFENTFQSDWEEAFSKRY